ncbi:hypothetical protein JOE31_001158 [Arthrobacter sp. PvP023]|nr:hypothetical protein [Arthrobacter sp. PvP023]
MAVKTIPQDSAASPASGTPGYLDRADSAVERPVRWLAGYAGTHLAPAGTESVEVHIPAKAFAHYDGGWQFEQGTFRLLVGRHAADGFQVLEIELR